jgi:putative aminopeptidase FrvX
MQKDLLHMKERLQALTSLVATSGYEDPVIEYVVNQLESKVQEIEVDSLGNVVVKVNQTTTSNPYRLLVFAHMDELGLVVKKIEENGFLRLERVGGIPEKSLAGSKLVIQTDEQNWEGIVGTKSHHVTTQAEKYKVLPVEEIYADFGFYSKNEVEKAGIDVGTPVAYARQFFHNGPTVFSNALDNRVGCMALLELADRIQNEELPCELYLVFSVQEEFNLRGVLPAIRKVNPHLAITLDITVATDTPELSREGDIQLGAGPSIGLYSFHGRGTLGGLIPNPKLVKHIKGISKDLNIPLQPAVFKGILTDASFSQLENDGFPIIDIGYPARYTHAPVEAVNLNDVELMIQLLIGILHSTEENLDFSRGYKRETN